MIDTLVYITIFVCVYRIYIRCAKWIKKEEAIIKCTEWIKKAEAVKVGGQSYCIELENLMREYMRDDELYRCITYEGECIHPNKWYLDSDKFVELVEHEVDTDDDTNILQLNVNNSLLQNLVRFIEWRIND